MTLNWTWVGVFLAGLILLFRYGRRFAQIGDFGLPLELRRAELVYAEQAFQTDDKPRLRARVDRAYRKSNGAYVLVELKTRSRKVAFQSDVIELSVQRVALAVQMNVPVELYGYVLIQQIDGRTLGVVRVPLLGEQSVYQLAEWRQQIVEGEGVPRVNGFPHLCKTCSYRAACPAAS